MILQNTTQMALLTSIISGISYTTVVFRMNFVDFNFAIQQTQATFNPTMNVLRMMCEGAPEFVAECEAVV